MSPMTTRVKCLLAVAVVALGGCGGGGSLEVSAAPPATGGTQPQQSTSTSMVTAAQVTSYTCDAAASSNTCSDSLYGFSQTFDPIRFTQYLSKSYTDESAANTSIMSCKQGASCVSDWGSGLPGSQIQAMQDSASAVVRIAMPNDHVFNGQTTGLAIAGSCTGVAVKSALDSSIYILTAAHCLYEAPLYPNMRYGSYRDAGVPVYVTFHYQKATCGGAMDFSSFGPLTVPSIVVAYNYSLNGWSAPNWGQITGGVIDFALLKLAGPLPAGVTPVTHVGRTLISTDKLFTFSHPFGLDKIAGRIDRGVDFLGSSAFQYQVSASQRITEQGSSGGPLFAYDQASNSVAVVAIQSGGGPAPSTTNTCTTPQSLSFARLDAHATFLRPFLGQQ